MIQGFLNIYDTLKGWISLVNEQNNSSIIYLIPVIRYTNNFYYAIINMTSEELAENPILLDLHKYYSNPVMEKYIDTIERNMNDLLKLKIFDSFEKDSQKLANQVSTYLFFEHNFGSVPEGRFDPIVVDFINVMRNMYPVLQRIDRSAIIRFYSGFLDNTKLYLSSKVGV